ncbi:phage major tail tube protein [Candidatus Persebacteraceae bacterium Df01]|jgi:P2 family phage contractile tail tube protein|uniref:Phage major tail tube protein n=1 Tax=Candidatus Doriopsillibacter californiensis TaxID=2970740 RepID=A0ABT7QLU6_9GAMM|nr:phage major tail tube protein [Candidatus Persebacteraceae bacterium Df01]MDM5147669.1 phage major tail tube protein [Candidatus Persebacteraceae bacterium Df01]
MPRALPKKISGVAVYVGGISYIGNAEWTPPNIAASVEESAMPGHGGAFDIPTGRLEKMDAELRIMDTHPALAALAANPHSMGTEVSCVSTYTDGSADRRERWDFRGLWREQNREALGAGDTNIQVTYLINIRTLAHTIDGRVVRKIDLEQDIHEVNGVDINAARRNALQA